MIEILGAGVWRVHWGGISGTAGGLDGKVTKCRRAGVVFYVRENLSRLDNFTMSSAQRIGMKEGTIPKGSRQVLELAAPAELWGEIAAAVREADGLGREVVSHRQFTPAWAEHALSESGGQVFC